jgi:hypothetical protein
MNDHQRRRELIAFARYCTARVMRGLGAPAAWDIAIEPASVGFTALVRAHIQAADLQATGSAADPMVAIWHAICDIEQPLRDAAARAL